MHPLGDVDVELTLGMRTRDHTTISDCTWASGKAFLVHG